MRLVFVLFLLLVGLVAGAPQFPPPREFGNRNGDTQFLNWLENYLQRKQDFQKQKNQQKTWHKLQKAGYNATEILSSGDGWRQRNPFIGISSESESGEDIGELLLLIRNYRGLYG
ncbi:hypothetical protein ACFFRR_009019 [Megaselia abdita]